MLKVKILIFGFLATSAIGMEYFDDNVREWLSIKLGTLLAQAHKQKNSRSMLSIGFFKEEFVEKYMEDYKGQQDILRDLCHETMGAIRSTPDRELAQEDPNKFLCLDPLECTASEIKKRMKRIHTADCKYNGPRRLAGKLDAPVVAIPTQP